MDSPVAIHSPEFVDLNSISLVDQRCLSPYRPAFANASRSPRCSGSSSGVRLSGGQVVSPSDGLLRGITHRTVSRHGPTGRAPMMDFWTALEELWAETLGDPRVRIAILDGPFDQSHPSLRGANLTALTDAGSPLLAGAVASQHGTHVTSIIFGQHGTEVRGIAPRCHGLIIPIFDDRDPGQTPVCSQADLGSAIDRAVDAGANIINISSGELSQHSGTNPILAAAIRRCEESAVLVIAAARHEKCGQVEIPAALPSVLAVGAFTAQGDPLGCTAAPENAAILLAPGEGIVGAIPGGRTVAGSGSSYAAAIVSGVAALLLSLQLKGGAAFATTWQFGRLGRSRVLP